MLLLKEINFLTSIILIQIKVSFSTESLNVMHPNFWLKQWWIMQRKLFLNQTLFWLQGIFSDMEFQPISQRTIIIGSWRILCQKHSSLFQMLIQIFLFYLHLEITILNFRDSHPWMMKNELTFTHFCLTSGLNLILVIIKTELKLSSKCLMGVTIPTNIKVLPSLLLILYCGIKMLIHHSLNLKNSFNF